MPARLSLSTLALLIPWGLVACGGESESPGEDQSLEVFVEAVGLLPAEFVDVLVDDSFAAVVSPWDNGYSAKLPLSPGHHTLALGNLPANCSGGMAARNVNVPSSEERISVSLRCSPTEPVSGLRVAVAEGIAVRLDGGDTTLATRTATSVAWAPDGGYLAFADAAGIWSGLVRGVEPRLIVSLGATPGATISDLAFSPDGNELAYFWCGAPFSGDDCTHEVRMVTLSDRVVRTVGRDLWTPAWAPDGSELAVGSETGIRRFDRIGRELAPILPPGGERLALSPAYNSDGRYLAYLTLGTDQRLRLYDRTLGTDTPIPTRWSEDLLSVSWLPGDKGLLFVASLRDPDGTGGPATRCVFITTAAALQPRPLVPCHRDIASAAVISDPRITRPEHGRSP